MPRSYDLHHVVAFEETNVVGNVYYVNHLRWQGRCREMFLREHAPDIVRQLSDGLALATVRVSCEFFAELFAFDEITVRMRLGEVVQNRILLKFEYERERDHVLVAQGEQEVACMQRHADELQPCEIPPVLLRALAGFA